MEIHFRAIQSESMSLSERGEGRGEGREGKGKEENWNSVNFIPFFRTGASFASGNLFRRGGFHHRQQHHVLFTRINQLAKTWRPPSQAWKCHYIDQLWEQLLHHLLLTTELFDDALSYRRPWANSLTTPNRLQVAIFIDVVTQPRDSMNRKAAQIVSITEDVFCFAGSDCCFHARWWMETATRTQHQKQKNKIK